MCQGGNGLLPLIRDKVNTTDKQCYIMKLNIKAVEALDPGQTLADKIRLSYLCTDKRSNLSLCQSIFKLFCSLSWSSYSAMSVDIPRSID